jgi:phosphatidylethanolamine/phosphatidyl-N-methylethanolamine N-methyltransferase
MPAVPHSSRLYHGLARFYDGIFTRLIVRRIHAMIAGLQVPPGARVLEVGVGTGLSLPAYPAHAEVLGVDLSEAMLQHAREKVERHGWRHVALRQMDALNLELPDASFDYVTAFHLVSVVPDTRRLMAEITRVCKPGGTLAIVNHLRSPRRWVAALVDLLNPVTRRLGWRTTLSYEELVSAAPIRVVRRFKTSPTSLFTVLIAEKPA